MSFERSEALADPLRIIEQLHAGLTPAVSRPPVAFENLVASSFRSVFDTDESIRQIPSLTHPLNPPESLVDTSLVRFRCMIQDTGLGTEIYNPQGSNGKCNMYREHAFSSDSSPVDTYNPQSLQERELFYGVEIPGEAHWVRAHLDGPSDQGLEHAISRLDFIEPDHSQVYRKIDVATLESTRNKYPIPGAKHVGALLKLYDNTDTQLIKTSSAIEVVGILGWTSFPSGRNDQDLAEITAITPIQPGNPQTISLIPCVHVIFCRLPPPLLLNFSFPAAERMLIRNRLLAYLTNSFFHGDDLAAQYLLAALTAKIHTRLNGYTIGALPLNLIYPDDPQIPSHLLSFLSCLLPRIASIPLTISSLNERPLFPVSNEDSLNSGPLQLSPSTTLLIDSRGMSEGQLNSVGLKNVKALEKIVDEGKLLYSFPYSAFEFDVEMGMINLSQGCKTFLNGFWPLPINPLKSAARVSCSEPSSPELNAWRGLIQDIRTRQIYIPESLSSEVQDTFVSIRRSATTLAEADQAMSQEDLSKRLELSRLLALQLGKEQVELEDWQEAGKLEKLRKIRLKK
ncbi:hypothetical protein O181_065490 [Austropuccinia psidii MF-1]|uniref:Mini-chromosome maintenance complex-binding protein n=1 Tax=Austropuccinia psidii MF-1 TaxID=1389203 RepID=A0A9Q3I454_9BASI|nr:hypothetical protein [Austropuccinia psidii MF-1]